MSEPDQPTPRPPGVPGPHGVPEPIDDSATDRDPVNVGPTHSGTRVDEVEQLPLDERAEAYRALHEGLARRLEQAPGDA